MRGARFLVVPLLAGFVAVTSFTPDLGGLRAEISDGKALLSWIPPTQNEDGSALTDLSHYSVYFDNTTNDPAKFGHKARAGGNLTAYMIEGLPPGTWCFAMTAVNASGLESQYSNVACKTIEAVVEPPSPPKAPGGLAAS